MITPIAGIPANMVAFRASGAVTKDDFDNVVVPAVEALVKQTGELIIFSGSIHHCTISQRERGGKMLCWVLKK